MNPKPDLVTSPVLRYGRLVKLPSMQFNIEAAVAARYSDAALSLEPALCCAVSYDAKFLEVIPAEIQERDYGCGNPAEFVRAGETVLDLGSGGGKICFIAAQIVGASGRVIGLDINPEMLALAEKYREQIGEKLGFHNVEFRRGHIQNLDFLPDNSVDVVLSNCVLNLVCPEDKRALFAEIFRVVKNGGRAAISDIVSSADVPLSMQDDAHLWSGCISGALHEDEFIESFSRAGFQNVELVKRDEAPWQTVGDIEFRSVTVVATKGEPKHNDCCD